MWVRFLHTLQRSPLGHHTWALVHCHKSTWTHCHPTGHNFSLSTLVISFVCCPVLPLGCPPCQNPLTHHWNGPMRNQNDRNNDPPIWKTQFFSEPCWIDFQIWRTDSVLAQGDVTQESAYHQRHSQEKHRHNPISPRPPFVLLMSWSRFKV
jgi:hypothetical protein